MSQLSRIALTIALAAASAATAFVLHGLIAFGVGPSLETLEIYAIAGVVGLLIALVLVPFLMLVDRFSPTAIRGGIAISISILVAVCFATWQLTSYKHFHLDLAVLVGRAWNIYLYYLVLGLTFGISWVVLVAGRFEWSASPKVMRA
jgi:hypothetical protein